MKIMDEYQIPRKKMITHLREHHKIQDEKVLEVMQQIPRHEFVPEAMKFQAYRDNALPIAANQTISQPYIVARMTELLELKPTDKILEIGAGSGYQTVVLAVLAEKIYSIERVKQLAVNAQEMLNRFNIQNVFLKCDDGTNGWEAYSPYDGILAAAGGHSIPKPLLDQLKVRGKLVIPIGKDTSSQTLFRITKTEDGFQTEDFGKCSFVPLIGDHGW